MSQSKQLALTTPTLSVTNFDLPSLHLLHNEIEVTLKNAEFHISEFNDDKQKASLLLDTIEVLQQLSCIFEMISLKGAQMLNDAIKDGLQQLYKEGDNNNSALIMDLSEAVITFGRYIEFVLLTETIEPSLLIPIINKLYNHTATAIIDDDYFSYFGSSSVVIANPEQNFESLSELNLDVELLSRAYRSGLSVVLNNEDGHLTPSEQQKIEAMSSACTLIATRTQSLFWQAANTIVTQIETILPLNIRHKHTLIYLEQQFYSYLPVMDKRFADLVSLACQRDHESAENLCQQYASNTLDETQKEQMKRFLFGPNRQLIDTLNTLIQTQINDIKEKIDSYLRSDFSEFTVKADTPAAQIADDLINLSSTYRLLSLETAAAALYKAADAVVKWQQPSPDNIDHLLIALMRAENDIIAMAEVHTPGEVYLPLSNANISLHQLNSAYNILLSESRISLANAEQDLNHYLLMTERDLQILQNLPAIMRRVAGALRFLQLSTSSTMLNQLARFLEKRFESALPIEDQMLARIADVMASVDYYLENSQQNRPISKHSLDVGQHSLSQLLTA